MLRCTTPASIKSADECTHPQEETALASTAAQALQLSAITSIDAFLLAPEARVIGTLQDVSPLDSLKRSSFSPPLRI